LGSIVCFNIGQYLNQRIRAAIYARLLADAHLLGAASVKDPGGQPGNDAGSGGVGSPPAKKGQA
jgi:hypothetical protein